MGRIGGLGGFVILGMAVYVALSLLSGVLPRTQTQSTSQSEAVAARLHLEAQALSKDR